jgi:hypothetical protein
MRRRMRLRKVGHDALPQFAASLVHVFRLTSQILSDKATMEDVVTAVLECFRYNPSQS